MEYLEMEYLKFINAYKNDEILVGIEPAVARRFFCNLSKDYSIELTNRSLSFERFLIPFLLYAEIIFVFVGIVLSIISIKWYSLIYIPLFVMVWLIYKLKASQANQNISGEIVLVVLSVIISLFFFKDNWKLFYLCVNTPLTFLVVRLLYKTSTVFLRRLAIKHQSIYELLKETGIFIKRDDSD